MKERPILFQGWKINKILNWDWSKGNMQIRRVVITIPPITNPMKCPYGQPGDLLWVRETWGTVPEKNDIKPSDLDLHTTIFYRANEALWGRKYDEHNCNKWRPSIYLPRWASRIDIEIVDIRVERVQEITHDEALMEGVDPDASYNDHGTGLIYKDTFAQVWDSINAKRGYGWNANPFCWVVEYRLINGDLK